MKAISQLLDWIPIIIIVFLLYRERQLQQTVNTLREVLDRANTRKEQLEDEAWLVYPCGHKNKKVLFFCECKTQLYPINEFSRITNEQYFSEEEH